MVDSEKQTEEWKREFSEFLRNLGPRHFILDENRDPVPVDDFLEAAEWFETADRQVDITHLSGDVGVSTVFLGLNHNYGSGPPLLFETAVCRDGEWDIVMRYETWDEAAAGHALTVKQLCEEEHREIVGGNPLDDEIIE